MFEKVKNAYQGIAVEDNFEPVEPKVLSVDEVWSKIYENKNSVPYIAEVTRRFGEAMHKNGRLEMFNEFKPLVEAVQCLREIYIGQISLSKIIEELENLPKP